MYCQNKVVYFISNLVFLFVDSNSTSNGLFLLLFFITLCYERESDFCAVFAVHGGYLGVRCDKQFLEGVCTVTMMMNSVLNERERNEFLRSDAYVRGRRVDCGKWGQ